MSRESNNNAKNSKTMHFEKQLQDSYADDKQVFIDDASNEIKQIKHAAIEYATHTKPRFWQQFQWQVSFAVVCLIALLNPWISFDTPPSPIYKVTQVTTSNNQNVYYHNVEIYTPEEEQVAFNSKAKVELDSHYQAYINTVASVNSLHNIVGTIESMDEVSGELVVAVCDLGLIKISPQIVSHLVTDLEQQNAKLTWMKKGKGISLSTNRNGVITDIMASNSAQSCPIG